jgi:hypothetical protein
MVGGEGLQGSMIGVGAVNPLHHTHHRHLPTVSLHSNLRTHIHPLSLGHGLGHGLSSPGEETQDGEAVAADEAGGQNPGRGTERGEPRAERDPDDQGRRLRAGGEIPSSSSSSSTSTSSSSTSKTLSFSKV